MAASGKSSGGQWIWICVVVVCLLSVVALFVLPYFETKPKSRDELLQYLPSPPQATPTPSPAAPRPVKKR